MEKAVVPVEVPASYACRLTENGKVYVQLGHQLAPEEATGVALTSAQARSLAERLLELANALDTDTGAVARFMQAIPPALSVAEQPRIEFVRSLIYYDGDLLSQVKIDGADGLVSWVDREASEDRQVYYVLAPGQLEALFAKRLHLREAMSQALAVYLEAVRYDFLQQPPAEVSRALYRIRYDQLPESYLPDDGFYLEDVLERT